VLQLIMLFKPVDSPQVLHTAWQQLYAWQQLEQGKPDRNTEGGRAQSIENPKTSIPLRFATILNCLPCWCGRRRGVLLRKRPAARERVCVPSCVWCLPIPCF
jgi:hypothetical protein